MSFYNQACVENQLAAARRSSPKSKAASPVGLVVLLVLFPVVCHAQSRISLPLSGYYRPGRYMPVHVSAGATLSASGALSAVADSSDAIVPLLIYGSPTRLNGSDLTLHALAEDEHLLGYTGDRPPQQPGIINVLLDPADPLPGPAVAWESLDVIVTDAATMSRIDDDRRSVLLAAGVKFSVSGDVLPDNRWPWKKQGKTWSLHYQPIGPTDRIVDESTYSPTFAWNPGWPKSLRQEVLVAGIILAILAVAISLWRCHFAIVAILFLSIGASVGIGCRRASLGSVNQAGGQIIVANDGLLQQDTWLYEKPRENGRRIVDWEGSTHPVFASLQQLDEAQVQLHVSDTGRLSFQYSAYRGQCIAFLRRSVRFGAVPTYTSSHTSPLEELAKRNYESSNVQIVGETPAIGGHWANVVITTDHSQP